jgi:DNA-binding HxlR family transcriptional regulator
MALGKDYAGQDCSIARALELIGERWTLLIVRDAFFGVRRYSDFLGHMEIPRAVLAERLNALTEAGAMARHRYQVSPPRDEYVLTPMGEDLFPVVYALREWGEQYFPGANGPRLLYFHAKCGRPLDPYGVCTDCGTRPAVRDLEVRPGPGAASRRTDRVTEALKSPRRLLEPI